MNNTITLNETDNSTEVDNDSIAVSDSISITESDADVALPPIVIFAYKRTGVLECLLESLQSQTSPISRLIVYIDGPADQKRDGAEVAACAALVHEYARSADFPVEIHKRETNMGCAGNTVSAIDETFKHYKSAIFLDDDFVVGVHFYEVLSKLLHTYRENRKIFSVSGFSSPIYGDDFRQTVNADFFVTNCFETWAWGTWRDRWLQIRDNIIGRVVPYTRLLQLPCYKHLLTIPLPAIWYDHIEGLVTKYRWSYLVLLNCFHRGDLFICPTRSLAKNVGCGDPQATNHKKALDAVNAYFDCDANPCILPASVEIPACLKAKPQPWIRFKYLLHGYIKRRLQRSRNTS